MEVGFVVWAMIGVGVGWLVGQVATRSRHGLLGNLIVGLMGALLSGYVTELLFLDALATWFVAASVAASFLGALSALSLFHLSFGGRRR